LTLGLTSVLRAHGLAGMPVTVVDRHATGQGTFPKEVVTCRCDSGRELRLFCKYGCGHPAHQCHGHRGGVAYEAAVYRQVLEPARTTAPKMYGTFIEKATGATWLILDHLDGSLRVTRSTEPAAMDWTVDWIGRFHAAHETHLARRSVSFLNCYDGEYYLAWARRTACFAGPWHRRFGWLAPLCERFGEAVDLLVAMPPTIIHGEYYPDTNVLVRDGLIFPVDWESAAIAAGEIDLAALSEKWPADVVQQWERRYQQIRWPEGGPADFDRRLAAARLYLQFRWLGERPEETTAESNLWRFDELKAAGERFGIF
jgi:hypothetical protein